MARPDRAGLADRGGSVIVGPADGVSMVTGPVISVAVDVPMATSPVVGVFAVVVDFVAG